LLLIVAMTAFSSFLFVNVLLVMGWWGGHTTSQSLLLNSSPGSSMNMKATWDYSVSSYETTPLPTTLFIAVCSIFTEPQV
jgi:hypothetical protein